MLFVCTLINVKLYLTVINASCFSFIISFNFRVTLLTSSSSNNYTPWKTLDAVLPGSVIDELLHAGQTAELVRDVERLEHVREGRVPAGDACYRRLEMEEALLLDGRCQLGAKSAREGCLVGDQHAARLFRRLLVSVGSMVRTAEGQRYLCLFEISAFECTYEV